MSARRLALFGLVILLAILLGVFLRREAMEREAAAPTPPAATTVEQAPESTPPAESSPSTAVTASESPAAAPTGTRPSFDVVRVEPNGSSVIAGRTVPGGEVELLSNGTVIGRTKANEQGEFVLMPPPVQPGSHEFTLKTPDAASAQAVTVSVPQPGQGEVLVVVGEPGKPSQIVQAGAPSGPSAGTVPDVPGAVAEVANPALPLRVGAVETGNGRLFVQGTGPAGANIAIYLNDSALAQAQIGADGRWSLTVEKGLDAGDYAVRVDQTDADGKVVARAEVPFAAETPAAPAVAAVPAAPAEAPAVQSPSEPIETGSASAPETSQPSSSPSAVQAPSVEAATPSDRANPVVREVETVTVKRGDSLWRISRRIYGEGVRYSTIYDANTDQIRNPNRIYPGQIFVTPGG